MAMIKKIVERTIPATARPRRSGPKPWKPKTRPAIVVGTPKSGMIHVMIETRPRTRLAVALPLARGGFVVVGVVGAA
jgi:hypothetical protein